MQDHRVLKVTVALRGQWDLLVVSDLQGFQVTWAGLGRLEQLDQWEVLDSKVWLVTVETLDRAGDLETKEYKASRARKVLQEIQELLVLMVDLDQLEIPALVEIPVSQVLLDLWASQVRLVL